MRLRRSALVAAAVVATAGAMQAQEGSGLRSADLIELALRQNRDWLAAREGLNEARGQLTQAGRRPAPAVQLDEDSARPFGSRGEQTFSAGYAHTFEWAGKRESRVAVAARTLDAVEAGLADRVRLLTLDVKRRYAEAIREQRKLATIARLAVTTREYYDLTRARVERGDAPPLEGQLLLVDLRRVEAQQIVQAGAADRALADLRRLVGVAAADPLPLAGPGPAETTTRSLEDLQATGIRERQDLRAIQRLEDQAKADEVLARALGRTDLTASARYSLTDSRFDQLAYDVAGRLIPIRDRSHSVSVGLSFFLFAPGRNRGTEAAARARASAARLRREHQEAQVRIDVAIAFGLWDAARRAVGLLDDGVIAQSERNLEVLRQAYALGQLRMLDVLIEQRHLLETELTYLDAQAEQAIAFAELEASVGGRIP